MHDQVRHSHKISVPWLTVLFVGLWIWAIWTCAEHWRGNPNYSYGWAVPLLALAFGLRRYWQSGREISERWALAAVHAVSLVITSVAAAAIVFGLEFARQQMWHPQIVLGLICLLPIAFSLAVSFFIGGRALLRAEAFPVLFFLTAVPWPPRIEQPITSTLMSWVAVTTAEVLHWMGVEAQTSGGAIALRTGLVGITEACSGIRSLQAGIMFGLAMGEWFLLRPARRLALLAVAIALALLTNLARTLALSLQAEWHGVAAVE
ncbi:MAG TPA: exosortase/archaeosortase family protein, partial [Chthoniobacterales bacterium]